MLKQFLNNSIFYTVSNLLTKGINFLLIPVYVKYLDKSEFGQFDFIITIGAIVTILTALELNQAILRFASENNELVEEKALFVNTGFSFGAISNVFFLILIYLNYESLNNILFDSNIKKSSFVLALFYYYFGNIFYYCLVIYRATFKAKKATILSVISSLVTVLFVYFCKNLSVFEEKINNLLFALLIGQIIPLIYCLFIERIVEISIEKNKLKQMLKYSIPLVLSSIGIYLNNFTDRLIVREYFGFESLAEYALSSRLSIGLSILTVGFQYALSPLIYKNHVLNDTKKSILKILIIYTLFSIFSIILIKILSKDIVLLIGGEKYDSAQNILLILSASVLLFNYHIFFPGLHISKKTSVLAFINIFCGIFNVLISIYLSYDYQLIGVALGTLLSSLIFVILNIYYSELNYPLFGKITNA